MEENTIHQDELAAEAAFHRRVREAITAMRETTASLMDHYHGDYMESRRNRRPGDAKPDQNLGFAMAQYRAARLDALADRDGPLFFGRLWLETGEDYHFGRRHVRDENDRSHPLVVDWRAPIAERFYRATAHHPMEVTTRRRFGFDGSTMTGVEDEDLRSGTDATSDLLTAEIERPRTGPMRDIVATIQPEQDELIRRDADTSLCVQGAPGTGKTAVGLHRAAWLLYTYPDKFRATGMLVLGPNEGFLAYIAGVLPALGETAVTQATVADLTSAPSAKTAGPAEVEALKHDARMAEVCERAVWSQLITLDQPAVVNHAGTTWTLTPDEVADAAERARAYTRTWTAGRKAFEDYLVQLIVRQAETRSGRPKDRPWTQQLKKQPLFTALLDHVWPKLTAKRVLQRLLTDREFRSEICAGLLAESETVLLHRLGPMRPTYADVLLLDEIQAHLKPAIEKTYAHIVIDEAQDLSAMQCRAVARRCPGGAITVLGDLAQGTTPWAATDWREQMRHLDREAEHTELTTGYRVPAAIIDLANALLPRLGVEVSPAQSLRNDGTVEHVVGDDVFKATAGAVAKARTEEGLIGVIAADHTLETIAATLAPDDRVQLVPARLAKGLEFDHVILVEPAAIVDDAIDRQLGLRHLYIALTRAVSHLTIAHTQPLPDELGITR